MNNIYQHRRHNKNLLMVHLIFATKYRKALLFGTFRTDVKQYMFDACIEHHWYRFGVQTIQHISGVEKSWAYAEKTLLERKNVMVRWLFCCIDRTGISGNH